MPWTTLKKLSAPGFSLMATRFIAAPGARISHPKAPKLSFWLALRFWSAITLELRPT